MKRIHTWHTLRKEPEEESDSDAFDGESYHDQSSILQVTAQEANQKENEDNLKAELADDGQANNCDDHQ